MYIQITNRCNMTCAHCCFSCTEKGEDMSLETFKQALKVNAEIGKKSVIIGGGEPTLHPMFWEFLGLSVLFSDSVWLATNGSLTQDALLLAKLAKSGKIACDLSQDKFHDPIDPCVVEAFSKSNSSGKYSLYYRNSKNDCDYRDIRSVKNIMSVGRAAKTGVGTTDRFCDGGMIVVPDGTIWRCQCMKETWGTIFCPEFDYDMNICEYCSLADEAA